MVESIPENERSPQPERASRQDGDPLVEVQNLSVSFGEQDVLRELNLTVNRGETVVIIGESGCGKTVLLKTLIALVEPTCGRVLFDGQDLDSLSERELTRQLARYGFVFQNAALFDSLTVGQNVAFPLRQHKQLPEADLHEAVMSRLAEVGLPDRVVARKPAELSGGMRKRVGLARALVMNPELILYDEPTTGLDPIMSDVINELLLRTSQQHAVTSVVVTHDMRTVEKIADKVVMLLPLARVDPGDNQVIFRGTLSELDQCPDRRVKQFVNGEAGERLMEMREDVQNRLTSESGNRDRQNRNASAAGPDDS